MARPIAPAESRHPLDHPIWNALASVQSTVAEGDDCARRYPAAMAPFAATRDTSQESYAALRALLSGNDRVALFTSYTIDPPNGFTIELATTAEQMVAPTSTNDVVRASVVELGERDVYAMRDLVGLTKPGPFGRRTHELGRFLGVWDDGQLVAMAGERMKMPGYRDHRRLHSPFPSRPRHRRGCGERHISQNPGSRGYPLPSCVLEQCPRYRTVSTPRLRLASPTAAHGHESERQMKRDGAARRRRSRQES